MSASAAESTTMEPESEVATPVPSTPPGVETTTATERDPKRLFRFSSYVNAGEGAEECEHREDGACANDSHFHAWVRLPNQFQHDSIRKKALAAKARSIRNLKDPESDDHAILEADLQAVRESDGAHDWLVEDLVNREFLKNRHEAIQEVNFREEYETIMEDLERLAALEALEPEERDADEFRQLQDHVHKYNQDIEDEQKKLEEPLRTGLADLSVDELISQVRDERIEAEATQAFMRSYSQWEWYTCTLKPRDPAKGLPKDRYWPHINEMLSEAPEVLEALDVAVNDLEQALNSAGN